MDMTAGDGIAASMGLGGLMGQDSRTRKRTPARAQKLVADLFLLAGRCSDAASMYSATVEALKSNSDYLWQAAATEGYYCAMFLSNMMKANAAVCHFNYVLFLRVLTSTFNSHTPWLRRT